MIKYHFNDDLQILEVIYKGDIKSEDPFKLTKYIRDDNKLPRKLKVLIDASNGNYNFDPASVGEFIKDINLTLKKYEFIKEAFIHSKPKETAYSILFASGQIESNYYHNIFSTKEAAFQWLIDKP